METQTQGQGAIPTNAPLTSFLDLLAIGRDRFSTNFVSTFANMTPEKWIRVVIIVGAYCLLRPYIIKLGGRAQMKSHEDEAAEAEAAHQAKISPNELRGQIKLPEDSDDEDDEGAAAAVASGPDWGKKARRRQRNMIKKLLDAEERRLQETLEEEEDKDIEEFLIPS
ncbi:protein trafficking Pga2 [Cercophora scortea]|uniref:Protein trafficking Pga2 n=1 Tax=Cercophora scortea TaxID=314031 RepID=A0AAE0IMA9_9PEZI|nr:protein trafficking Pga2 [Cercophora scortea]